MSLKTLMQMRFIPILLCVWFINSCKAFDNVEYRLVVDVHEFEVRGSPDLFHRKPETYLLFKTEITEKKSDIFYDYKVDFTADDTTYNVKLKGKTYNDDFVFSVELFDFDWIDIGPFSQGDDRIGGVTMRINKNSTVLSETVTIDDNYVFLVFTYRIENIKVND